MLTKIYRLYVKFRKNIFWLYKYPFFIKDFFRFKKMSLRQEDKRFNLKLKESKAFIEENVGNTGFDRHYVYHTAWAVKRVIDSKVSEHVDFSSYIYFIATLSASVNVTFYDLRPPDNLIIDGLTVKKGNLSSIDLEDNSVNSLSSLHVLEHIGLGRYGDEMDPFGDKKAIDELKRILAKNGRLYIAIPVGKPCIVFNGHRIYSYEQVMDLFEGLELEEFSLICDGRKATLIENADKELVKKQQYGCGCFIFRKSK